MTTALSASLLADMTEQDKIGLAKQLSMTSAAALDDANLEAALRASRQEALRPGGITEAATLPWPSRHWFVTERGRETPVGTLAARARRRRASGRTGAPAVIWC